MKLLMTTGTTDFRSLLRFLEGDARFALEFDTIIQSPGVTKHNIPSPAKLFEFIEDIDRYYLESDLIISHAGAGTIYRLLELKKKFIVVPNLDRHDKHQLQITQFVSSNHYALSCVDLGDLYESIHMALATTFNEYIYDEFAGAESILSGV